MTATGVPVVGTDKYAGASNGGCEGWRHGPTCALPRLHAGQASGGPYRHQSPGAEDNVHRKRSGHRAVPRSMQNGRNGAQWAYDKVLELPGAVEAQSFFQEGCPGNWLTLQPHQSNQARLLREREDRGCVDRSEANVCVYAKQGGGLTRGSRRPHVPDTRPSEERIARIEHLCSVRRQLAGGPRHMRGNEGSDGRRNLHIFVGMRSNRRGRPSPKAAGGRPAACACRCHHKSILILGGIKNHDGYHTSMRLYIPTVARCVYCSEGWF